MMHRKTIGLGLAALALCAACERERPKESQQQQRMDYENEREQGQQQGAQQPPRFNPENIKTYRGQVLTLMGRPEDMGILLRTEQGEIPVRLGPSNFILEGPVNLENNPNVEVVGSEVVFDGRVLIIAKQLRADGHTLKLRDNDGNALWTGWRKD